MIDLTAIQEATEQMEMFAECEDYYRQNYRVVQPPELLFPAIQTALAALRECAERREGCVFCGEKRHHIREAFDDGTAQIIEAMNNYALSIETPMDATTSSVFPIHYCPMCGRKLERSEV